MPNLDENPKKPNKDSKKLNKHSTKEDFNVSFKEKLIDFLNDTATLDVLTLSGTIELVASTQTPPPDPDEFKWDDIFSNLAKQLKTKSTEVSIVAYTHAEWDQDSVNYVAAGADATLLEAHNKTVAAAHEARMNALRSVAEAIEKLV